MDYPAASNGVSIGIFIIAPRGAELNLYQPPEGLPAGGLNSKSVMLKNAWNTVSWILHPTSCILDHGSWILNPESCILYHASCIMHPEPCFGRISDFIFLNL
jgi:hypothetical protein